MNEVGYDLTPSDRRPVLITRRALFLALGVASLGGALATACGQRLGGAGRGVGALPTAAAVATPRVEHLSPSVLATPSLVESAIATETSARRGGTLVAARQTDAQDLDPQLGASIARQRLTPLIYGSLLRLGPDLSIRPELAEAWRVDPDGTRVQFTLRKGVLWHPPVSRELTADDVRYSFERLLKESPGRGEFAAIESIDVLDRYDVAFSLKTPQSSLLAMLADPRWGAIVNRETVERFGDLRSVAVGSGPFILEHREPGAETHLRRNPEYYVRGRPYVDWLILKTIADESEIFTAVRAGPVHHAPLEGVDRHQFLEPQGAVQIHRSTRLAYDLFHFNQRVPPFDRPEVIQAVSIAIDRSECIRSAAHGLAVLTAPCAPSMKQWQIARDDWERWYSVDLVKARRLLAEVGLPNGFEATALTIPQIPTMQANAQVVQANLKRVGINLTIESLDYSEWLKRWQAKEFQCTFNSTIGHADPDMTFYRALHSRGQNWNNISDPELDKLLERGRATFEIEKRKPIYDQVQRIMLERPAHLYLFSPEIIDVTRKSVRGFRQHPTTTVSSYENVWLEQQA